MNQEYFNSAWAALINAFPNAERITDETQAIYWEMLKLIPDDIWQKGIQKCLRASTFFPTIHDIGVACFGEQKEEWVERTDPWRRQQNFREKIPGVSWQQRMEQVLRSRNIATELSENNGGALGPYLIEFDSREKDLRRADNLQARVVELERENAELRKTISKLNLDVAKARISRVS